MDEDHIIVAELKEQTQWLRLLGFQALRPLLDRMLLTDQQKLVYEGSNGDRSTREVGTAAGVSHTTVANLWQEWAAIGIVSPVQGHSGRYQHLVPLSALGYVLPAPGERSNQSRDPSEGAR